jgi:uncharacterized membrane protein YphA (DoxX/SURF4 family)
MSRPWWLWLRRGLALALGAYFGLMFVRMGWIKFDPNGFWTKAFERWGYPVWLRIAVGVVETAGGVALVVPWVATYGGVGLAVVMAGAWFTRFHDGRMVDVAWITTYFLGVVWIAYEWRSVRLRPRRNPPPPSG